jgi:hypothetical protein
MKVSLSSLNTLLEQVEEKNDIILSADRGDFQDVMKGDPFDYVYDAGEDIFRVTGLNSKRERLSDKKVARLEQNIGARLGSSSKAYDVLKKRMGKSSKAEKKDEYSDKVLKSARQSLSFLKTSSVDGKKIGEPKIALTLSIISESDLDKLVAAASKDINKYSSAVQAVSSGMYGTYNELINGLDIALAGVDVAAMGAVSFGVGGKIGAVAATLTSLPVALTLGVGAAIGGWYAGKKLDKMNEGQIEVVLMDLYHLMRNAKPKSRDELAKILKKADPGFMRVTDKITPEQEEELLSMLD